MTFYRKQGGGNVAPSVVRRRQGGGWADAQFVRRRQGGAWVDAWIAYTPMSGSISPNPAAASGKVAANVYVSLALQGGQPPFTYNWYVQQTNAAGGGSARVSNGNANGTEIWGSASPISGGYWNGQVVCNITDATGRQIWISANCNFSILKKDGGIEV